ncbi:hypothetical protein OSTOST_07416, partial [Ostertagia ostertagi]
IEQKSRKILPGDFLRLVDKEQESTAVQNHSVKQLPYFLKDLSISNRNGIDVPCESTDDNNDFIRRIGDVLDSISAGNVDVSTMQELSKIVVDEKACDVDKFVELIARIVSIMDSVVASPPNTVAAFFAMFENLFCSLSEEVKRPVMKEFYEAWHV